MLSCGIINNRFSSRYRQILICEKSKFEDFVIKKTLEEGGTDRETTNFPSQQFLYENAVFYCRLDLYPYDLCATLHHYYH